VGEFGVYFEVVCKEFDIYFGVHVVRYIVYEEEENDRSDDAALGNTAGYRDWGREMRANFDSLGSIREKI
jgi:hypothetical protein